MALTLNSSGITFSDSTTLTSHSPGIITGGSFNSATYTISGIPAYASKIWINLSAQASTGTTDLFYLKFTSGYYTGQYTNSISDSNTTSVNGTAYNAADYWTMTRTQSTSYDWMFSIELTKHYAGSGTSDRYWIMQAIAGSTLVSGTSRGTIVAGHVSVTSTDVGSVVFGTTSGNNAVGSMYLMYA